ncbi:hypothetical protein [Microbacterium hominis]|uniref:Uncharacterized protein n=1 Tax=Microbacterium hominis TaxID=162426 RepID=A0A7D4TFP8_9MICO|nr:hypothetical protein [Microbacterium hominis]QKJ18721.1 hypothetical protein HQM25_04515 [Microbacterium hominis]
MSTIDLAVVLEDLAYAVAEHGTAAHRGELEFLAVEAHDDAPAAADALVDWTANEVTRLRAFGLVHGAILRQMHADRSMETSMRRVSELYRLAA